jgi:hypothetical protein
MKAFRFWMSYVSGPVLWIVLSIVSRFGKNSRLRIGKLLFLGPASFVALCKQSVERLHNLDPDLHQHLTEHEKVYISYDPERLSDMPDWRMFTVTDRYVAWREDGIISRLVYIYFKNSVFLRYSNQEGAEGQEKQQSVVAQWKRWLEAHNFATVLGN